jgi:hypothetical protein
VAILNGTAFTIGGVTQPEFFGARVRRPVDFSMPLAAGPAHTIDSSPVAGFCGGSVRFEQQPVLGSDVRERGFVQNRHTFRRMFVLAIAGIVAVGAVHTLRAQTPLADTRPPAFEVASVKLSTISERRDSEA